MIMDLYGCSTLSSSLFNPREPPGTEKGPIIATEETMLDASIAVWLVENAGKRMEALEEEADVKVRKFLNLNAMKIN